MQQRMIEIMRRREQLIARASMQRSEVSRACRSWEKSIGIIDRGLAVAMFFREHPVLLAGVTALLMALGRRNLLGWVRRGWIAWRLYRSAGALAAKLRG